MARPATVLIISGSDSAGAAGMQADLLAVAARGAHGASALTAVTAQGAGGVTALHPLPASVVTAQIRAVLEDQGADAVKIGMLGRAATVRAVARALHDFDGPVVLDPVLASTSGTALLDGAGISALRRHLLPAVTLLTPNLPEAARLLDRAPAATEAEALAQGAALLAQGPGAVLVKGGHGAGATCTDWLVSPSGTRAFRAPRSASRNTRGTGCALASAIAAELAQGAALPEAVETAHRWLQGAIAAAAAAPGLGSGAGPVRHFHEARA